MPLLLPMEDTRYSIIDIAIAFDFVINILFNVHYKDASFEKNHQKLIVQTIFKTCNKAKLVNLRFVLGYYIK